MSSKEKAEIQLYRQMVFHKTGIPSLILDKNRHEY